MYKTNVELLRDSLFLKYDIVGVEFIYHKNDWNNYKTESLKNKETTFCSLVRMASEGKTIKGKKFKCKAGARALGILDTSRACSSGQIYSKCGLYETYSVANRAIKSMNYIDHDVYGVLVGPLKNLKKADSVIIIGNPRQVMRIIQGYAYERGECKNLSTIGNQAICSDLVSKPFNNNDINISFLCRGARIYGHASDNDMGVGFPIGMLESITKGVIKTLNVVETPKIKKKLKTNRNIETKLDIKIDMDSSYVQNIKDYEKYLKTIKDISID